MKQQGSSKTVLLTSLRQSLYSLGTFREVQRNLVIRESSKVLGLYHKRGREILTELLFVTYVDMIFHYNQVECFLVFSLTLHRTNAFCSTPYYET